MEDKYSLKRINIDLHSTNPQSSDVAGMGVAFEGADRFNRSVAMWQPRLRSADVDLLPEKNMADARSRDISRNDGYIAGAMDFMKNSIVGTHYKLRSQPKYNVLGKDKEWAKEFKQEVEEKFTLWAESPDNWVDAARVNDFTSLIRLAVGVYAIGGEVLATAEYIRTNERTYRTAIQMVDPDRLQNPYGITPTKLLRGGIQKNRYGAPVAYYIRESHPIDFEFVNNFEYKRVPTYKPWGRRQVIHIFEQQRPDQTRGVSMMVSVLKELNITKKFREIVLQNAVVNATYAAAIESDLPSEAVFAALGAGNMKETDIHGVANDYLQGIANYVKNSKNMTIDGVKIPHLYPGTKLKMISPGQGGPLGTDFESSLLRHIASALGLSYEQLSRDFSETNYSSARAAMTETWKNMQARKKNIADRFANEIYRLWLEEAIQRGFLETVSQEDAVLFYQGLNKEAFSHCSWIGAGRGQIDELKETQAAALRIDAKLSTREREAAHLGLDWDDILNGLEKENEDLIDRGLSNEVESNMMNSVRGKPGQIQPENVSDEE
jgi:lambda family phage portal protein